MGGALNHTNAFRVGVSFLVIPDGFRFDGNRQFARLSLAPAPTFESGSIQLPQADIREWPREIAALSERLRIAVGSTRTQRNGSVGIEDGRYLPCTFKSDVPRSTILESKATKLWQRIFAGKYNTVDNGFDALISALKAKCVGPKAAVSESTDQHFGTYQAADLATVVDTIYDSAAATEMLQRIALLASKAADAEVLTHAGKPGVPFWKMLHDDFVGFAALQDAVSRLSTAFPVGSRKEPELSAILPRVRREFGELAQLWSGNGSTSEITKSQKERTTQVIQGLSNASNYFADQIGNLDFWQSGQTVNKSKANGNGNGQSSNHFEQNVVGSEFESFGEVFANSIGDLRKDSGEDNRISSDIGNVLKAEIGRFCECLGHGLRVLDTVLPLTSAEENAESAGRKFSSILSHPTLAKYLGLIIDIEVDTAWLLPKPKSSRSYGAVAVDVAPIGSWDWPGCSGTPTEVANWPKCSEKELGWTTYVALMPDASSSSHYFGPCSRGEATRQSVDENQTFKDGFLNLNVRIGNDQHPRFKLETLDVNNATLGLNHRAVEISEADIKGSLQSQQATQFPERNARGIALYDRDREHDEIFKADCERNTVPLGDVNNFCIRYLDDLLLGFRIDAAIATKGGLWRDPKRWRPLVARTVKYGSRDVDSRFLRLPSVMRARNRDDGHVRPMTGQVTLSDGSTSKTQTTPSPDLFTWPGESLAVPALPEEDVDPNRRGSTDCRTVWPNPHCDLAIDIDVDLPAPPKPKEVDRRPLPLRDGRGYMFGARLYLVNGCGVDFESALPQYISSHNSVVLGDDFKAPFVYQRRAPIPPPDVVLPWNDRIVLARKPEEVPGETIDYLVVRSGELQTKKAQRFIVPPRTSFDLAERHGVFDNDTKSLKPSGAFVGDCRAVLHPKRGTFPVARVGSWEFPDISALKKPNQKSDFAKEPSRGAVLVLDDRADVPRKQDQLYPDPLGRRIRARFVENGQTPRSYDESSDAREFWSRTARPMDARPILLELRAGTLSKQKPLCGWFDALDTRTSIRPRNSSRDLLVNKLSVVLAPAEAIDLELWSDPDAAQLLDSHQAINHALDLMKQKHSTAKIATMNLGLTDVAESEFARLLNLLLSADRKAREKTVESILKQGALQQVTSKRVVRLIHAVDRPLAPYFRRSPHGRLLLHAVVISLTGIGQQPAPKDPWANYVEAQERSGSDLVDWPSQEGGTTTFFVGEIGVDRPTTSRVRCEGRWLEYGRDTIRLDDGQKKWITCPPFNFAQLFAVEPLSSETALRSQPARLLRDDGIPAKLRALSHAFPDGKARHLHLRLISTSRFTDFYPPETKPDAERKKVGFGRYERATEPFSASTAELWVDCTFRPPQPEIDRVLPVFRWSTRRIGSREISWKRESTTRVFLKSPRKCPWYASGEGEVLGVVCWPKDLVDSSPEKEAIAAEKNGRLTICDMDILGQYAQYVTRWGSDPIHLSGQLEDLIAADRFGDFDSKTSNLLLTIETPPQYSVDSKAALPPLPVSVIAYKPQLDPVDGSFYCDITVDHGSAYFPFVQLGLVRYQAHAVPGLELSRPIAVWAQVPPRREGNIVFKDDRNLTGQLHGIGYHRSETGPGYEDQRHLTDFPLLHVRLMQATRYNRVPSQRDGSIRWRPVVDKTGRPVEQLRMRPIQHGAEVWWTFNISLPKSRKDAHYGLIIEEVELMVGDKVQEPKDANSCEDLKFPTAIVERGPLFSHIVDLGNQ